jgi:4-amino-4-deoxy-L-arabinose transferase-like glycosyltransferase
VFALALALRLYHVLEMEGTAFEDRRGLISDSRYYDMRATEIAGGDVLGSTPGFLSPTYCAFLGACYAVTGAGAFGAKIVQAVLGALTVVLAYRVGARVFSEAAGALAALLLAVYGLLIFYAAHLLPTTLVCFLHALLLWILVRGREGPFGWTALGAGLVVGLAIGTKSNALLLLPAIGGWIVFGFRERARFAGLALFALGAVLTVAPITWRNYQTSGEFVLVTTTGGRNLLKGNGAKATGTHRSLTRESMHIGFYLEDRVDVARAVEEDRELSTKAWNTMIEDPARTLSLFVRKFRLFFHHVELGIRDNYQFMRSESALLALPVLTFGVLVPIGLVGLLSAALRSRWSVLVTLVFATQVASFVLVFVLARYRVVAVFCLALFAAEALVAAVAAARRREWKRVLVPALLLVPTGLFVHDDLSHFDGLEVDYPLAEQHCFVGDWHFERGEWDEAIANYDLAMTTEWRLFKPYTLWEIRDRIGDCYLELGKRPRAIRMWAALLDEMEAALPARPLELKDSVREKLAGAARDQESLDDRR